MASVRTPIEVARQLAVTYGQAYQPPFTYPLGVALSGRLRLARLDGDLVRVTQEIVDLVEPWLDVSAAYDERFGAPALATACWADELYQVTKDPRYRDHLLATADRFQPDPDIRVEDFFFGGTLLGRAYASTGDDGYQQRLVEFLAAVDTQTSDGLFWHCHASPFFWGRGNAFAAMGFAEALSYVEDRGPLLDLHLRHCRALLSHQDESGMWHQVIDDDSTYLEHSATTMIGYAFARGVQRGWLPAVEFGAALDRVWLGIEQRTSESGELEHVCVGTGPLSSLEAYVTREHTDTTDERGGAMALWFAAELASVQ